MDTRNHSTVFSGLVVNLEQMEVKIGTKGWHRYQVVRHPGGVAVLPLHSDGTVTLIRQLRPAVAAFTLELPAGRLDHRESPEECGRRELAEETGLVAAQLESLGPIYSAPGYSDEIIHLYLATDLRQGEAAPEAYEDIEIVRVPLREAIQMAKSGRISDAKTIVALLRAEGGRS